MRSHYLIQSSLAHLVHIIRVCSSCSFCVSFVHTYYESLCECIGNQCFSSSFLTQTRSFVHTLVLWNFLVRTCYNQSLTRTSHLTWGLVVINQSLVLLNLLEDLLWSNNHSYFWTYLRTCYDQSLIRTSELTWRLAPLNPHSCFCESCSLRETNASSWKTTLIVTQVVTE